MPVKIETKTKKAPRFIFMEPEIGKIKAPKRTYPSMHPSNPPKYMNREVVMDNQNVHTLVKTGVSRWNQGSEAVRTVSSRLIPSYMEPPGGIRYPVPQDKPTFSQVNDYIRDNKAKGYGVGAVVTRRFISVEAMCHSEGWGIITATKSHVPFQGMVYNPYLVKWFQTDRTEPSWAEDLFIIMPIMERDELVSMIADQAAGEVDD